MASLFTKSLVNLFGPVFSRDQQLKFMTPLKYLIGTLQIKIANLNSDQINLKT